VPDLAGQAYFHFDLIGALCRKNVAQSFTDGLIQKHNTNPIAVLTHLEFLFDSMYCNFLVFAVVQTSELAVSKTKIRKFHWAAITKVIRN